MFCYYHPGQPAVGLCKHCQRGLCSECIALVDDCLACKGRHEAEVRAGEKLARRNNLQSDRLGLVYVRNAIFYFLVGVVFAGLGLLQYRFAGLQAVVFILVGVFLLYAAIANFLESRKYN